MLRDGDLKMEAGPCEGGCFVRFTHAPTGISRGYAGPTGSLKGTKRYQAQKTWIKEIETELAERGLTQYLVPDYPSARVWQGQKSA